MDKRKQDEFQWSFLRLKSSYWTAHYILRAQLVGANILNDVKRHALLERRFCVKWGISCIVSPNKIRLPKTAFFFDGLVYFTSGKHKNFFPKSPRAVTTIERAILKRSSPSLDEKENFTVMVLDNSRFFPTNDAIESLGQLIKAEWEKVNGPFRITKGETKKAHLIRRTLLAHKLSLKNKSPNQIANRFLGLYRTSTADERTASSFEAQVKQDIERAKKFISLAPFIKF